MMIIRHSTALLRPVALGLAVVASAALSLFASDAPVAATERAAHPATRCKDFTLTERFIRYDTNMPSDLHVPAGFQGDWFDELLDASGTRVGTAVGSMDIMYRAANGDDMEYQFEMFHFPEGTFQVASEIDRADVISGAWVSQPITGTSGVYRGWHGIWRFQLVLESGSGPDSNPSFVDSFHLCGPR